MFEIFSIFLLIVKIIYILIIGFQSEKGCKPRARILILTLLIMNNDIRIKIYFQMLNSSLYYSLQFFFCEMPYNTLIILSDIYNNIHFYCAFNIEHNRTQCLISGLFNF